MSKISNPSLHTSVSNSEHMLRFAKRDLCIIGTNETADRLTQFCERYDLFNIVGYAVDRAFIKQEQFRQKPVWAIEDLNNYIDKSNCLLFVAMFWNHLNGDRRRLYERLKSDGWQFANIVSPLASVRGSLGDNCWVMDYAVMQEESVIGNNVIVSDFCFVGDYSIIEDHVFLGARSTVMGSVHVGEQSFVGIGATVFDVVHIGKKCLVGACTVQKYDLPDYSTSKVMVGNNEIKHFSEEEIESKWVANHPNRFNKNRG